MTPEKGPAFDLELAKLVQHVKSLAVAQIAIGALALMSPILIVVQRFQMENGEPLLRQLGRVMWTGEVGAWMVFSVGLHTAVSIVAIGFGFVTRTGGAATRALGLLHAVLGGLSAAIGIYAGFFVLTPALLDFAQYSGPVGIGGAAGGIAGLVVGTIFSLVLPGFEAWLMTRARVREAIEAVARERATI
jgi:hypothetical protein